MQTNTTNPPLFVLFHPSKKIPGGAVLKQIISIPSRSKVI